MKTAEHRHHQSRLGRLLVDRGCISEDQLLTGLRRQRESGQRLGEVLIQSGWLSEQELHRILRHQTRYRHAIALAAMVSLPLQPLVSFASTGLVPPNRTDSEESFRDGPGLVALSDEELAGVAGQGVDTFVDQIKTIATMAENVRDRPSKEQPANDRHINGMSGLKLIASTFFPVLGYLHSSLSISGVHYSSDQPRYSLAANGTLTLALPARIDEVRLEQITVNGPGREPSMGAIRLHDIQFDPRSQMTLSVR